jgi:hypothetical protein
MGDRLYNPTTGAFTSTDPEPGGNTTAYTYPQDPINGFDLDGHWGHWRKWAKAVGRFAYKHSTAISIGVCAFSAGVGCGLATAWAVAVSVHKAYNECRHCSRAKRVRHAAAAGAVSYVTNRAGGIWRGGKYLRLARARHARGFSRRIRVRSYHFGIDFRSAGGRIMRIHEAVWGSAWSRM